MGLDMLSGREAYNVGSIYWACLFSLLEEYELKFKLDNLIN